MANVEDNERNILIISGIFGGTTFLLFVLVIALLLMIKDLKRKLANGAYSTSRDNLNTRGYQMYPPTLSRPPPPQQEYGGGYKS